VSSGPKVSVIINNFNYARFLTDAIDSVLAQTYSNLEVIVVDDGSTDSSIDVMAGYGDKIIPVLKENGGQGSAYNAGYAKSSGDLVCFLDADDTLLEDAIAATLEMYDPSDVVKIQWPMFVTDAAGTRDGRVTAVEPPPRGQLIERVVEEGPLYDFNYHTNCVYSRAFLDHVMPVPEPPYRNGADVYLTTLAPIYGVLETLSRPFGTYRLHGANNYADRPLDDERLRDYIRRFDLNAEHLAEHLRRAGRDDVDPDHWRATAFNYLWPTRLLAVRQHVERLVPRGGEFILIDGGEWGGSQPIAERRAVRVVERDGLYWGPPASDSEAIDEVERLFTRGAELLVLWWTCYWWEDAYPLLLDHLDTHAHRLVDTDAAVIFCRRPGRLGGADDVQ
jgi:glycosyltransferase involved in cell wall biosynthesis